MTVIIPAWMVLVLVGVYVIHIVVDLIAKKYRSEVASLLVVDARERLVEELRGQLKRK